MSTTIIYRAKCEVAGDQLRFLIAARDNNICPYSGRHSAGLSLEVIRSLPLAEVEQIAGFCEGLARDYDGGCIKEKSCRGHLTGWKAYRLWAFRVKQASGIALRAPLYSSIRYSTSYRPGYLPRPRLQLTCGQVIPWETVRLICREGYKVQIKLSNGSSYRLGFLSSGDDVCVYAKGCRRRGHLLSPQRVVAAASFDSYGDAPWLAQIAGGEEEPATALEIFAPAA